MSVFLSFFFSSSSLRMMVCSLSLGMPMSMSSAMMAFFRNSISSSHILILLSMVS